ncbi:MAG: hypothetical protein Kow0069_11470 [Promethearchaeota archaeon]
MTVNETGKFYLGIDLGTTNSSVARIHVLRNGQLRINVVPIYSQQEDGSWKSVELVPSCVYFPADGSDPIVGPRAKAMLRFQSSRVVRSIKTSMGDPAWVRTFGDRSYHPVDMAECILRHLMRGIKTNLRLTETDVVITVPASFDADMREATLEAARRAGVKMENDDGNPRSVLLDEPVACLLDFIELQRDGTIPETVIEFGEEPKVVLVYDLGGGTLDVSLHRVLMEDPNGLPKIEDLGISRYTELGGDLFDQTLAEHLLKEFVETHGMDLSRYDRAEVEDALARLVELAENWKRRVTNRMETAVVSGRAIEYLAITEPILAQSLLDMRPLMKHLSVGEYVEILGKYLAPGIQFPTSPEDLTSRPVGLDLVSPIIDVLKKAHAKTGQVVTPDLVILSGGMTRVHVVKDRLQQFFPGVPLYQIPDPDLAVSRGAAIYHYYLHQGYAPKPILAEAILLKVRKDGGEGLHEIVPAGAEVPFGNTFSFFTPDKRVKMVALPFYRSSEQHPLRSRVFDFGGEVPSNTEVAARVHVDTRKVVSFKAWLVDDPTHRVSVTIDLNGESSAPRPAPSVSRGTNRPAPSKWLDEGEDLPPPDPPERRKWVDPRVIDAVFGKIRTNAVAIWEPHDRNQVLHAQNLDEVLKRAIDLHQRKRKSHGLPGVAKARLVCDFFKHVAKSRYAREYFPEKVAQIRDVLRCYVEGVMNLQTVDQREVHSRVAYSINCIGEVGQMDPNRKLLEFFRRVARSQHLRPVLQNLFVCVGKHDPDSGLFGFLVQFLERDLKKGEATSLLWALARQGRRQAKRPVPAFRVEQALEGVLNVLSSSEDPELTLYSALVLTQWGCFYEDGDCLPERARERALNALEGVQQPDVDENENLRERWTNAQRLVRVARKVLEGREIEEEERRQVAELLVAK